MALSKSINNGEDYGMATELIKMIFQICVTFNQEAKGHILTGLYYFLR